MGRARDFGRRAWDWLSVADARPDLPVPAAPAYRRPRMMFDGADYRPIDQVIRQMWSGQGRVTQEEALAVPGVLRARNLICAIATWPVVDLDRANKRHRNPLLEQMDPNVPNVVTLAQIYQDLLFEGVAWCRVLDTDRAGYPAKMEHLAWPRVSIVPAPYADGYSPLPSEYSPREAGRPMRIMVDGQPADPRVIKRFDSPNPGVLKAAGASIKLAAIYRRTATLYAEDPRMDGYLYPKDGADPVQDEAVVELLDAWELARRSHATGYIPAALGYEKVENLAPADLQLVQLQEQATREVALALGLEPADLGVSVQTETYSNRVDKRIDRINDLLGPYVTAFDQRMSMGDITPGGHRVYSDPNAYLRANPTERMAYAEAMLRTGAWDQDDVSDAENVPRKAVRPVAAARPGQEGGNVVPIRSQTPAGTSRVAAAAEVTTFDAAATDVQTEVAFIAAASTSDVARRLIRGVALPYGPQHIARKNGRRYRFQQGSIVWPNPRHVPLLIDHVQSASVGHFQIIDDQAAGTDVIARVSRGPAGDQALVWASEEESVRTGLSVGVDFDESVCVPDPENPGVWLVPVGAAIGKEISLVAVPAYQGARVTSVVMSSGGPMHCTLCGHEHAPNAACVPNPAPTQQPAQPPAQPQQQFNAGPPAAPPPAPPAAPERTYTAAEMATFAQAFAAVGQPAGAPAPAGPQFVDPTAGAPRPAGPVQQATQGPRLAGPAQVVDEAPYRFDARGQLMAGPEHDLSHDLVRAGRDRDGAAYSRVLGFMREMTIGGQYGGRMRVNFDVDRADLAGLNPVRNRPDMWVPQRDYTYPLVDATRRGTLADITAFTLPKFSSSSGLVSPHTEGTEPTAGSFVVTTQTITPTAKSGSINMTREAWDQGGTPQATAIIWDQFVREWNEELESGVAAFLNTLTAAADITLGVAVVNKALALAWRTAIARLQFARGGAGRFDTMATEQELYVALANAETDGGEPIFPMINPQNRDGSASSRYTRINAAGVDTIPSWALASTAAALNNSWLFDSTTVHTWDTGPQRLDFPGHDAGGAYAPIAYVKIGVWGYQAVANTDITGVRQVTYDSTAP